MAVAQGFGGAVSLACVQSAGLGKQFQASCPCVHALRSKGKSLVTSLQSLQAIRLPSPQLSMVDTVFATRRSAAIVQASSSPSASDTTINPKPEAVAFKHLLLPVIDRNPYLSDSTRQTIATTTALAKQYGADVTVVVIDYHVESEESRDTQEGKEKHDLQLETIRWHLSEGGCEEYTLTEKLGEKQKPTAIIGEMADDLGLDLVVMSMEAIHHKHVDGNLLGEFVPCPILMLPL